MKEEESRVKNIEEREIKIGRKSNEKDKKKKKRGGRKKEKRIGDSENEGFLRSTCSVV